MIYPEDLNFTPITPENSFAPDQIEAVDFIIRSQLYQQEMVDLAGAQKIINYILMVVGFDYGTLQPFVDRVSRDIHQQLGLTEEQVRQKVPHLYGLLRHTFLQYRAPNEWLASHSAMTATSEEKKFKLQTSAAAPEGAVAFQGFNADLSSLVMRHLDVQAQAALDRVNREYHEGMMTFRRQKIREEVKAGRVLYAIAEYQVGFAEQLPVVDKLISASKYALDGRRLLMFTSKEDACAFAYSTANGKNFSLPIMSLVNLSDQPIQLSYLDSIHHFGVVECAHVVKPQGFLALGIELYNGPGGKPLASVLLKTPFDVVETAPAPAPEVEADYNTKTTRFYRNEHHKLFMKKLKNNPLTVKDLLCWIDKFYCEQYLRSQKDSQFPTKRMKIRTAINQLLEAEKSGLYLGMNLQHVLEFKLGGMQSLKDLICERRKGSQDKLTWGWDTIQKTFIAPVPIKMTRRNRDELHQNFMESLEGGPTRENLIRWLREWYCPKYLCKQKGGASKSQNILACLDLLEHDNIGENLSLSDFLKHKPNNQSESLGDLIRSCRAGEKNTESWGWTQVQNSFIHPGPSQSHNL